MGRLNFGQVWWWWWWKRCLCIFFLSHCYYWKLNFKVFYKFQIYFYVKVVKIFSIQKSLIKVTYTTEIFQLLKFKHFLTNTRFEPLVVQDFNTKKTSNEKPKDSYYYYYFFIIIIFFFYPSWLLFQFNFHFCLSASRGHTSAWQR